MDTDDLPFSTQETSSMSPLRLEYAMDNKRRGKAVIINNKKFDYKKTRRTERKHSDADAASLYTVFKSRGFDAKLCNDQTVAGMKKLFQECKYFPKQYLFVGEYLPWDFVIWLFVPESPFHLFERCHRRTFVIERSISIMLDYLHALSTRS